VRRLGILVVASALLGGRALVASTPPGTAGDAVLRRDEEMAKAVVAGDVARLEDIYAEDYVYVGSEGRQVGRAERLAAFRTGALRYLSTKHTGATVRVYGDTAVVQGRTHSSVIARGRQIEGDFQYVGIWVRRDGRWRIVLTQATRIAD